MKTFPPSLPWAPNRIQSREARKLVSNRLAETKKYAPEAKKVVQQEFQVQLREYHIDNVSFYTAWSFAEWFAWLQASNFFVLLLGVWHLEAQA